MEAIDNNECLREDFLYSRLHVSGHIEGHFLHPQTLVSTDFLKHSNNIFSQCTLYGSNQCTLFAFATFIGNKCV